MSPTWQRNLIYSRNKRCLQLIRGIDDKAIVNNNSEISNDKKKSFFFFFFLLYSLLEEDTLFATNEDNFLRPLISFLREDIFHNFPVNVGRWRRTARIIFYPYLFSFLQENIKIYFTALQQMSGSFSTPPLISFIFYIK